MTATVGYEGAGLGLQIPNCICLGDRGIALELAGLQPAMQ